MIEINGIKYDLAEMRLEKCFKRLMDFAQTHSIPKVPEKIVIVEETSIKRYFIENKLNEIPEKEIHTFEDYQPYFDVVLLNQGHSWINLHLLGFFDDLLVLSIELPNYKNDAKFTSVNFSLPDTGITQNNWDASKYYRII